MSERSSQAVSTTSGPSRRKHKPYFFTREIQAKFSTEEIAAAKAWYVEHGHEAGPSQNYDRYLAKVERRQRWVRQREAAHGADHEYHASTSEVQREEFTGDESESRLNFEGAKPNADEATSAERLQNEIEHTGEDVQPEVLSSDAEEKCNADTAAVATEKSGDGLVCPMSRDETLPRIIRFLAWLVSQFQNELTAYFQYKDDVAAGVPQVRALSRAARENDIAQIRPRVIGIELWLRAAYPDLVQRLEFESVLRRALGDYRKDAEWAKISSAPVVHDYVAPEPSLPQANDFLPKYRENGLAFREHRGGRWRLIDFAEPAHDQPEVVEVAAERKPRTFTPATVRKRKRALENGLVKFLETAPAGGEERDRMSRLVDLVGQGQNDGEIAAELGVSRSTVTRLKRKLASYAAEEKEVA